MKAIELTVCTEREDNSGNIRAATYDEFITECENLKSKYNVDYKIINFKGPSGGWPDVKFIGEENNIKSLISEWYLDNINDPTDMFTYITDI